MSTNYPNGYDNFINPTPTTREDQLDHAAQHADANDAIEALQQVVGLATDSAVDATLTGRIVALEAGGGSGDIDIADVNGLQAALDAKGTVSSVALTVPNGFSVTGSPVTSSGGFDVIWDGQDAGLILAAPADEHGDPTFRSLVTSDLPDISLAGTSAYPSSITINSKGQITSISAGSAPAVGTVTSVTVSSANGFGGSVANATTTPTITLSTTITGLAKGSGGALVAATAGTDYEVPISAGAGLTRSTNTFSVNSTQNITKLSNLTTNGILKTSGGDGTIVVDTSTYLTSAVTSINSQSGSAITIAVGNSGSDFGVASAANTITLNLPDASATARGVLNTTSQTIAGAKAFNSLTSVEGLNVTNAKGANLLSSTISGNAIYYNQALAVFTTAAAGSVSGADTGGYVDITTAFNTTTNVNITNGGTLYNRFYIGYAQGVPRILTYYASTTGLSGAITWERWNGSGWTTISVSNLLADGSTAITTASTSKTTINGVNAFWIRGTVSTSYTRAPLFRFGIGSGFSNMQGPESGAGLYVGKANLPSSVITAITNNLRQASIAVVNGGNGEQDILAAYSEYTGALIGTLDGGFSMTANNADNTFRALTLNGGGSNFAYCLKLGDASRSMSAWGANGCYLQASAGTMTDSSTASSGTASLATFTSFAQPTLAATNTSVTTTEAATVYIAGAPVAGTNQTLTNSYALSVNGKVKVDSLIVNKASTSGVVTLTDAATIALDASLGNHFVVTLGGNRTLGIPTNPRDGQKITLEVIQDATGSRTLTPTTGSSGAFAFGTDITSLTLTTTANARDLVGFVYSASKARWLVVSVIKGY